MAVADLRIEQNLSCRSVVRNWIAAQLDGVDEVKISELAGEAVEYFRQNPAFMEDFLHEELAAIVYNIAQGVMASTRGASIIRMGDKLVTENEFNQKASNLGARWARWMEHVGDQHILLLNMTKSDLIVAAKERRGRADYENGVATLWESLAKKLKNKEKVGDHFSLTEIDLMARGLTITKEV